MMKQKCPHCGSERVEYWSDEQESESDSECTRRWDVRCEECGEGFIIFEVLTVTSRLVARDGKELVALRLREEEER